MTTYPSWETFLYTLLYYTCTLVGNVSEIFNTGLLPVMESFLIVVVLQLNKRSGLSQLHFFLVSNGTIYGINTSLQDIWALEFPACVHIAKGDCFFRGVWVFTDPFVVLAGGAVHHSDFHHCRFSYVYCVWFQIR